MNYFKNCIGNLVIVPFLIAGAVYVFILTPVTFKCFSISQNPRYLALNMSTKVTAEDELERALDRASMGNKTLIIALVNKAYVEGENKTMLDFFLDSFWLGENTRFLLNHLLLVTVDQIAFDKCIFLRLHCYRLVTEGVDFAEEKLYMSSDYIKMMWTRTLFLTQVLVRGYNFIFTDIDIMWLRNPFKRLNQEQDQDIQLSCDRFSGDPWSERNQMNTGFYFVRSNNRTVSLFQAWYANAMKDKPCYKGMKQQDVLQKMMQLGVFRNLRVKVMFLDTLYFSGFCQDSRDFKAVTTLHANCCRTITAKIADLMAVLRDWKLFKASIHDSKKLGGSSNETRTFRWSKHAACWKSMGWVLN